MFCWKSHRLKENASYLSLMVSLKASTVARSPRSQRWNFGESPSASRLATAACWKQSSEFEKKTKDYFWKCNIFIDLAASLISGSKVDVPLELFAQSSYLGAARMDSGIWIQHRWIFGIIVLEMLTTPTNIRYANIKEWTNITNNNILLTTPSPIPLLPPVTIATGIFRSGKLSF